MKLLTASIFALRIFLAAAQNDGDDDGDDNNDVQQPDVGDSLPFTSVVTGPWYANDPPYQSLAGTKVFAQGGRLRLSNSTTADVRPKCRKCVKDTVIFVDGKTSNAYLNSERPLDNQLYIDPVSFAVSYRRQGRDLPDGAITTSFMRVGDNPRRLTTSPPTPSCPDCGPNQAPAMWTWPINSYINSFYACPDQTPTTTSWTLYQRILYYSDPPPQNPPNNCTYVQLAALNWRGKNPAVASYQ